jgi:hypothetical protein
MSFHDLRLTSLYYERVERGDKEEERGEERKERE